MLLQQLKDPTFVSLRQVEEMYVELATEFNALVENTIINEAVTAPLSDDIELQADEISKRLEAASLGLKIAKKLKDPVEKKKHTLRILSNMKQIKRSLHKFNKMLAQYAKAEEDFNNDAFGDTDTSERVTVRGGREMAPRPAPGRDEEMMSDFRAMSAENEEESMCGFCAPSPCHCEY